MENGSRKPEYIEYEEIMATYNPADVPLIKSLNKQAKKFIRHLGKESFFELC
jgi:hypothetical protein